MTMTGRDGTGHQRRGNAISPSGGWTAPVMVSTLLLSAALAGACGSSSSVPAADAGSTTPDAAAAIGTIVRGTEPCTEPHSICVYAKIPADVRSGQPTKLQIDLYSDIPPTHPPEGIPIAVPTPELQAGETVQLRMTDLGMTGTYYFLGLLFMPGGGASFPVAGVDYNGQTAAAYPFTGAALNLPETIVFADFN
jgi:hypothetical protein